MARPPFSTASRRVGKTHAAKRDERLRRVFTDKPSALKHVLNRLVEQHREAVTEGLTVFQHNADPMISIASKSSKFGGFTAKQGEYVLDVITDDVHAKMTWLALSEVDPAAWAAASKLGADGEPIPEKPTKIVIFKEDAEDLDDNFSEPGFVKLSPEPAEPAVADRPANWGMF